MKVTNDNGNAGSNIIVAGYSVTVSIVSCGQRVKNMILTFSH